MADTTIKQGDTWPPLRGRAEDSDGPMPLASADGLEVILKGDTVTITGVAAVIDPPDADGFNWRYVWADTDTAVVGVYQVELEITWDALATPPQVQTVPNVGFKTVEIVADLGGTR